MKILEFYKSLVSTQIKVRNLEFPHLPWGYDCGLYGAPCGGGAPGARWALLGYIPPGGAICGCCPYIPTIMKIPW